MADQYQRRMRVFCQKRYRPSVRTVSTPVHNVSLKIRQRLPENSVCIAVRRISCALHPACGAAPGDVSTLSKILPAASRCPVPDWRLGWHRATPAFSRSDRIVLRPANGHGPVPCPCCACLARDVRLFPHVWLRTKDLELAEWQKATPDSSLQKYLRGDRRRRWGQRPRFSPERPLRWCHGPQATGLAGSPGKEPRLR